MHKAQHHPDHGEGAPEVLPTDLETQRVTFFGAEYKPQTTINFSKIKESITKKRSHAWTMKKYTTPPDVLCDHCIEQGITCAITDLESLSFGHKQCLSHLLLEIDEPAKLHKQYGEAMLFWIWHFCVYYGYSRTMREKLVRYMVEHTSFGANDGFPLLQKAYDAQRLLFHHDCDIATTLCQYDMSIHLDEFLQSREVKQIVTDMIGSDYHLEPLFVRSEYTSGHDQTWWFKHFAKDGREIDYAELDNLRTYDKSSGYKFHKMPRYDNPRIHRDRSGEHYALYMDAPMGMGIFHEGRPLAYIAFSLRDKTTLFINQMQSVKATHYDRYGRVTRESVPAQVTSMPRQQLLTKVTELLASQFGCTQVMIQGGANNKRTKEMLTEKVYNQRSGEVDDVRTTQAHLSQKNAHRIYDLFAQKQGYTKDDERGDWIKDL